MREPQRNRQQSGTAQDASVARAVATWPQDDDLTVEYEEILEPPRGRDFTAGDRIAPESTTREPGRRRRGLYLAGVVIAAGLGWLGGSQVLSGPSSLPGFEAIAGVPKLFSLKSSTAPDGAPAEATGSAGASGPAVNEREIVDLVRSLKDEIAVLRDEISGAGKDEAQKLAALSKRLERLEKDDQAAKLAAIEAKLEEIESQLAAPSAVGSADPEGEKVASAEPRSLAPAPAEKPPTETRLSPLEGWVVRDVRRGVALVEGRNGYIEVVPGTNIPGVGRVEAIQRRGREWAVITSRGVIPFQSW